MTFEEYTRHIDRPLTLQGRAGAAISSAPAAAGLAGERGQEVRHCREARSIQQETARNEHADVAVRGHAEADIGKNCHAALGLLRTGYVFADLAERPPRGILARRRGDQVHGHRECCQRRANLLSCVTRSGESPRSGDDQSPAWWRT